ncbi:MAG: Crp/Fnr family transcriptional regulator [Cytophagales bacterium]|nr:Crp/Fnr family transcriptional regulator [Cytophaga sp.]
MKNLELAIRNTVSISASDMDLVHQLFKPVTIEKNDHFLEIGKRCNEVAFVESGLLRIYNENEKGEETTFFFAPPNTFVTSHKSFDTQEISSEGVQAVQKTELFVITKQNLDILYSKVPVIQELGRKSVEAILAETNNMISMLLNSSAEERYQQIVKKRPEIIHHVPMQNLASYLGITPQHLSRLRKNYSTFSNSKQVSY